MLLKNIIEEKDIPPEDCDYYISFGIRICAAKYEQPSSIMRTVEEYEDIFDSLTNNEDNSDIILGILYKYVNNYLYYRCLIEKTEEGIRAYGSEMSDVQKLTAKTRYLEALENCFNK